MLSMPHTQIALWKDNPISIITPLLQPDISCTELILVHPKSKLPTHLNGFLSQRGIRLISMPYEGHQLPLESLSEHFVKAVNVTQGNTAEKDQLLTWARKQEIACYWLDHNTDTMAFLAPHQDNPIAVADKLKINDFLALKGIEVSEIMRQPPNYQRWLPITIRWVNELSRYEKGFRTLNYLAKTADADHHITSALTLAQQNNSVLSRLLDELEEEKLLKRNGNKVQFSSAEAKRFCNGIWLEYYAFGQIKVLAKTRSDIQDIAMSVKVERGDKANPLRNEIDVMVLINNRLYLIECKTGMLEAKQSQLALYRLDSLAEVFGSLTQGVLLSFDTIVPLIKRRAKEINIQVLDHHNMVQLRNTMDSIASQFEIPE